MLTFMTKILQADKKIVSSLSIEESKKLIDLLFRDCLFEVSKDNINFSNIKCKSSLSRKAALEVLEYLVKRNLENSVYVLETGLKPLT